MYADDRKQCANCTVSQTRRLGYRARRWGWIKSGTPRDDTITDFDERTRISGNTAFITGEFYGADYTDRSVRGGAFEAADTDYAAIFSDAERRLYARWPITFTVYKSDRRPSKRLSAFQRLMAIRGLGFLSWQNRFPQS